MAAVPHSERVPQVAREAENEGKIDRNRGDETERRHLRRRRVQLVLQHVGGGDIDEIVCGEGEIEQQRQRCEIRNRLTGRQKVPAA